MAPTDIQVNLAHTLTSRFSHSLRRVDMFLTETNRTAAVDYQAMIPNVQLTSLGMTLCAAGLPQQSCSSFKDVTTLILNIPETLDHPLPQEFFFPRLRNLSLHALLDDNFPGLHPFIERHHKTLNQVRLQTSDYVIGLSFLISEHHHIQALTMDSMDLYNLESSTAYITILPVEGVRLLGIARTHEPFGAFSVRSALTTALEIGLFPDLQVVRLLGETNHLSSDIVQWEGIIKACKDHSVRLEDRYGRLLVGHEVGPG